MPREFNPARGKMPVGAINGSLGDACTARDGTHKLWHGVGPQNTWPPPLRMKRKPSVALPVLLAISALFLGGCTTAKEKFARSQAEVHRQWSDRLVEEAYQASKAREELRLRGSKPSRDKLITALQRYYLQNGIDPTTPVRMRNFGTVKPVRSFWVMTFEVNGKNKFGGWTGWQSKTVLWALDGKFLRLL
jgi:hypothetical protein